ncbi:site-specific DNA-methyltransferase [Sorangium cellulosum]|uniref:site-specific DNA-methyltransferase n=1 Tax=Sorangium cellulosum TaxID=56 RepID=UPI00041EAD04|nr:site-specific DNA-methyltransferase [Sorangium cellulosum]
MTTTKLREALLSLVPAGGATIGNTRLRQALSEKLGREIDQGAYEAARDALVAEGILAKGQGRGGSVRFAIVAEGDLPDEAPTALVLKSPEPKAPSTKRTQPNKSAKPAAPRTSSSDDAQVLSYRHSDRRKNNPEVGMVDPDTDPVQPKTKWSYDPHLDPSLQFDIGRGRIEELIDDALASSDQEVMRRALEQLKRQAEPYLNWTGKAERTSFEVDTVSLHVHERIDPASVLNAVHKHVKGEKAPPPKMQLGLFSAPFENLPLRDAADFYKHDKGWSNRLIAGDSLLVMNSLLQKEGMAGRVQMVFIDPPYGIKYGSNFQPFTNRRDVKDRKDEDLTQEPETLKAFRDTWELGLHSYLTYLRDRLLLAKELLHESGSVFVQISDENLHLVRNLLDEVFGRENALPLIVFRKTTGAGSPSGYVEAVPQTCDFLLWFAKSRPKLKFRRLFLFKAFEEDPNFSSVELEHGARREMKDGETASNLPNGARVFRQNPITSQSGGPTTQFTVAHQGLPFDVSKGGWKTNASGMQRLSRARRLLGSGRTLGFLRYAVDFACQPVIDIWDDTRQSGFGEAKVYAVQTAAKVIERCLLMTTDPGDLVLDPTCGSGTTAFAAEKWGRRWITCDTSRVAVTLAKQRLMTASFDYYELKYPLEGLKGGFIYKTVPHVTLKSIANNPEIDGIYEQLHPAVAQALDALNQALRAAPPPSFAVTEGGRKGKLVDFKLAASKTVELPSGEKAPAGALLEWEVPFDFPDEWPTSARTAFDAFHEARRRMQRRMDASISVHADPEVLYDQPQVAKDKMRITGPFSVEAVPFPTVLALDEARTPEEADVAIARAGESSRQHQWRDELLRTGIRGKGRQLMKFAALETLPDTRYLHVSGTLADTGERVVVSFGPEHGALEQRQVEMAMREAGELFPRPKMIVFAAFAFDPEAAKDIDQTKGIVALKAQMNTDLLTEDLKKARSSNQSFWLMGQPDIDVRKRKDGLYEVEVNGFDYFDTAKGELVSGGKGKIAVWLLDTDYDERSLFPRQVFFPMAGTKDGWNKLQKDIRAELDESRLSEFHGTISLPFRAGENKKAAVKVVDDRGIESLKVIRLD